MLKYFKNIISSHTHTQTQRQGQAQSKRGEGSQNQTKSSAYQDINAPFYFNEQSNNNHNLNSNISAQIYLENTIVHRCVSLIASSASHVPWKVYRKSYSGAKSYIENHHIANLLKHPNPEQSGSDFFTNSISDLLLYGNSYSMLIGQTNNLTLYNMQPNKVQHVLDKNNNKIIAYKYYNNTTVKIFPIPPITNISKILHLKNYNPIYSTKGASPISPATRSLNLYHKIMQWNNALLNNSTRPTGVLSFKNGNGYLSEEQFARLQEQFYSNFVGVENSGKPFILEGGLSWQETNSAEKFEKFIELKDSLSRDIAIAFNIPPQLLGIQGDNTYSNMQEARLALWEENIIPLLDKYADALSYWLSHWQNENLTIEFDLDAISILSRKRQEIWSKLSNANFMTINEKRALLGLKPIKNGDSLT